MKQVLIKSGGVIVEDIPAPRVSAKTILVRVSHSCISAGTEMAGVTNSGMPLYRRALKQPENVKRVLEMVQEQGLTRTLDRVRGKLSSGSPTGYSAAGEIIAIGSEVEGFAVGNKVACAGAGIANHAEIIDVPVNLAVTIPNGLDTAQASTVTLGAIALQGVRRANPTLGETFVVVGLGILGQLTAQMLKACGCRVIGVDVASERIKAARELGMAEGLDPSAEDYVAQVQRLTEGFGADGAIVTAASASDEILSQAFKACRRKGRVILVGDVGLSIKRADIYAKELDFLVSTSYGPGRYDPVYEEGGQDYPRAYVRWTENRNMAAYLDLLASGAVRIDSLTGKPYEVDRAPEAYESLKKGSRDKLITLLSYPSRADAETPKVNLPVARKQAGAIRVGLAGAGGFAQGMHLPNMVKLREHYQLRAVMSRTGANAKAVATQYEAAYAATDFQQLLDDPDIDLVMIATRHDLHASMVLAALQAGKHVFVEKPLSLDEAGLTAIESFYRGRGAEAPVLMTGFNRRFSPGIAAVRATLSDRSSPLIANYRMNAGYIPSDHWVQGPEGGGRNLGEACHIYDTFRSLVGASITSIEATAIGPRSPWRCDDNFVATLRYQDGSVCTLTYTALGAKTYPKERLDVFADGKVVSLDDYKSVTAEGAKIKGWSSSSPQKGQFEELEALAKTLRLGAEWPIPLAEQLETSRAALAIQAQITGQSQLIGAEIHETDQLQTA